MDIVITGIKFRAITTKLIDFLTDVQAYICTDGKTLDVIISSSSFVLDFESDEREEVTINVIKRGKRLAYTLDSVDFDSVTVE